MTNLFDHLKMYKCVYMAISVVVGVFAVTVKFHCVSMIVTEKVTTSTVTSAVIQ